MSPSDSPEKGIERYSFKGERRGMTARKNGQWVRYEDRTRERDELQRALEEAEDRFESCDNCERPSREEDLKVVWCKDGESGEAVDARICLVCRLEVERDEAVARERERIAKEFEYREGEDPEGLQDAKAALEGLYDGADLHDPNCGIPHPADPDQGSRGCTCGIAAIHERFSEAIALSLDQARAGEQERIREALGRLAENRQWVDDIRAGGKRREAALDSLEDG